MSRKSGVFFAVLVFALYSGHKAFSQADFDDEPAPSRTPRAAVRTTNVRQPQGSQTDPESEAGTSSPRQAASRASGSSKGVQNPRRVAPDYYSNGLDRSVKVIPAEDEIPADDAWEPTAAAESARSRRGREMEQPQRRTTINRGELAAPRSRNSRGPYQQVQFEEDPGQGGVAQSAPPQTFATAFENDAPDGPAETASLEEQLAELRARVDELSKAAPAPEPTVAMPSTVPGSVFGPDNISASGKFISDGLTFTSQDGNFKTHIGGVVQWDTVGFGSGTPGITSIPGGAGIQPSTEFRRLRVRAEGTMYENIDWVAEIDLALALQNTDQLNAAAQVTGLRSFPTGVGVQGGNTTNVIQPTTVFMTFKAIPVLGNIRMGWQQSWFSLEHIESARFLDFMERAPIMDAFSGANNNGYAPGISAFNNTEDQRLGLQMGIYKNNVYDSGFTYNIGDAWTYGGRVIATPYYDEESKGRYLLHTGVGAEYRTLNTNVSAATGFDNVRVRSRGDIRNAASTLDPNFADTGNFYALSQVVLDPEIAFMWGPFLLQAEYTMSWFNGVKPAANVPTNMGTCFMEGGYVETLYFLTGENRSYNRQTGVFGRTIPKENADIKKGTWGAWQVGLRYDWLDLNSGTLMNGGNASDFTFGINWFLNPNARLQFNYVLSWVNNAPAVTFPGTTGALNGARFVGDGSINTFGGRLDFTY